MSFCSCSEDDALSPLSRFVLIAPLFAASLCGVALLAYDLVLVRRLVGGAPGHVADPAIAIPYIWAVCGLIGSGIAYLASRSRRERMASIAVLALAVAAAALWLFLHLGHFVYSHSSMFAGK
jgi:hypothetical protein